LPQQIKKKDFYKMSKSGKILLYGSLFSLLYITSCIYLYKDSFIEEREKNTNRAHLLDPSAILPDKNLISQNQIAMPTPIPTAIKEVKTPTPTPTPPPQEMPEEISLRDLIPEPVTTTPNNREKIANIQTQIDQILQTHKITFYRGSRHLTKNSKKSLDKIANLLKELPTNTKIIIKGYTDASGSASKNRILSYKRAVAVKRYLEQRGINPNKIEAIGYGEENFIDKTNPYNPINRRVEIEIKEIE